MEFGQIEAFERSAREGSFTRAAESLGLTQPAVSTRITLLEAELGGPLFERRGRELKLTALGERFLPYARRMLDMLEDSIQAVKNYHAGRSGEVKIAAPTPFILSFLVDTLATFRQQHPTVDILIRERNKATIIDMLYDRVITLGLVNAPVFDRRMTQHVRLHDPIRAVAAPSHPLVKQFGGSPLPVEALYNHTIFRASLFPQMTAFIDSVVEHSRPGSGGAVLAVPMVMAYQLVMQGQGVTLLPESYVRRAVEDHALALLNIEDMPPLISQPVLISHQDRALDPTHEAFIEVFKNSWRDILVQ